MSYRNMNIVSNSKLCLRERHLSKIIRCNFSQSECCRNKNATREAKFFGKLLGSTTSKKKKFYIDSDIGSRPSLQSLTAIGNKNKTSKENSRRVHVLNKLFMKNITDLMVTGQHSADIIGHGIEISRVAVTSDFKKVNVYWLAGEEEDDSVIEKLLSDVSLSLRHELSQLRVMGVVPRIEFIKDKHYERVIKVERLLNTLDLSEEVYVEDPTHCVAEGSTAGNIELPTETEKIDEQKESLKIREKNQRSKVKREEIQEIVLSSELKEIDDEPPLPPVQHNTLNLDHAMIMNKIKKAVDKSKALHRKDPNILPPSPTSDSLLTIDSNEMSEKERREELTKFLLQRKILREKALKREKKYGPEIQLPTQDIENKLPYEFVNYKEPYDSEQDYDYIEEDSEERSNR